MATLDTYGTDDLKLVYTTLQAQLMAVDDLIESAFLADLQAHLRSQATAAGIDTSDHQQWAAWLATRGNKRGLRLVED